MAGFSSNHSCSMMKITLILLISMTITFNIESAQGRKIPKRKSVQDKLSAQPSILKEENSALEVLKSKLPSGPSPGSGNALINDGGVKNAALLKNKLPSGSSPGTGHAYINDGGVKNGWRAENILKNKLPSGSSPGTGNSYINDGGIKSSRRSENILKNELPSGSSPGVGH